MFRIHKLKRAHYSSSPRKVIRHFCAQHCEAPAHTHLKIIEIPFREKDVNSDKLKFSE